MEMKLVAMGLDQCRECLRVADPCSSDQWSRHIRVGGGFSQHDRLP